MLRLKACGWGLKRIAAELGCSRDTVKRYVATGGVLRFPFAQAGQGARRTRGLAARALSSASRRRRRRSPGSPDGEGAGREPADAAAGGSALEAGLEGGGAGLRPVRDAAGPAASDRFRRAPGRGRRRQGVKAFLFIATLGRSRRRHVRAFRDEKQESWFAGLKSAFTTLGGVPEEGCLMRRLTQ